MTKSVEDDDGATAGVTHPRRRRRSRVSQVDGVADARRAAAALAIETAERVRQVAAELGYRGTSPPRACCAEDDRTIGVVVPRLTDTVMAMLFEEIARAAGDRAVRHRRHDRRPEPKPTAAADAARAAGSTGWS